MTYYRDLSEYCFLRSGSSAPRLPKIGWLGAPAPDVVNLRHGGTRNVGWLDSKHEYPKQIPTEELLELLWQHCKISVIQTRGIHKCDLCSQRESWRAARGGEELTLGAAEIRVFSNSGLIYAAPNLIYHYVAVHNYCPPDEFLQALKHGPCPPNAEYFHRLATAGLEWRELRSNRSDPS